jgi:hypothetical protein
MSEGAWTLIRRTALGEEGTTLGATPAGFTNPRGVEGFSMNPTREALPDLRHTTSRKAQYASKIGQKSASCSFRVPIHADIVADLDAAFKSALGAKSANTTLTFSSSTTSALTTSAGTFDPVILVTANSILEARPIKSVSGAVGTFAIKPNDTPTTCANAATNNGALYYYDPTAATTYVRMQADRDSETDEIPYTLSSGYVTKLQIELDLSQRLGVDVEMQFGDWTQEAAAGLADPDGALSGQLLGYAGEAFIQSIGTPAVGTQLDVHGVSINLCCERIRRDAMRAPTATTAGSAINGVYSGRFAVEGLKVTLTKAAVAWLTARTAATAYGAFFSWSLGTPGASTTADKMAIWLPRVVVDGDPVPVDIDGIEGLEVMFKIEEDTTLTAPYNAPCLAFFSAA